MSIMSHNSGADFVTILSRTQDQKRIKCTCTKTMIANQLRWTLIADALAEGFIRLKGLVGPMDKTI